MRWYHPATPLDQSKGSVPSHGKDIERKLSPLRPVKATATFEFHMLTCLQCTSSSDMEDRQGSSKPLLAMMSELSPVMAVA